jgi:hypothetical protein
MDEQQLSERGRPGLFRPRLLGERQSHITHRTLDRRVINLRRSKYLRSLVRSELVTAIPTSRKGHEKWVTQVSHPNRLSAGLDRPDEDVWAYRARAIELFSPRPKLRQKFSKHVR